MSVELKPDRWRLRGGQNFKWGERYQVACEAVRVTDDLVILTGMTGRAFPGMRGEIGRELAKLGFQRAMWEDATGRVHVQDLTKYGDTNGTKA